MNMFSNLDELRQRKMKVNQVKHQKSFWPSEIFEPIKKTDTISSINCLKVTNQSVKLTSFLILVITMIITSVGIFGKYFERETYMDTFVVSQNNALFPAITICPITAGYKNEVFKVGP